MAGNNGRRLGVLTRALELHRSGSAGTRSTAEDAFLRLIADRLPEPLVNTPLFGEEVDFYWPDRQLVVEVDGPAHGRPTSRRDDAARTRSSARPATASSASPTRRSTQGAV